MVEDREGPRSVSGLQGLDAARGAGCRAQVRTWIQAQLYATLQPPKPFSEGHQVSKVLITPTFLFGHKVPTLHAASWLRTLILASASFLLQNTAPAGPYLAAGSRLVSSPSRGSGCGLCAWGTAAAQWLLAHLAGFLNLQGQCQCSCNIF